MTAELANLTGSELIERAMAQGDKAACDLALSRIEEKSGDVKRAMDAGVSPNEFKRLNSVHTALTLSTKVVERAWHVAGAKNQKDD